jgi:DNA-binding MarR family transcriptional regulator
VADDRYHITSKRHLGSNKTASINGGADSERAVDAGISTRGILRDCLYFTANALARTISRIADQEFCATGLSPSHAFLLMLVAERPGTAQKELGEALQLAPSTVTRFVDSLVHRNLLTRQSSGRIATVSLTRNGRQLLPAIHEAWWGLHRRYSARLGKAAGEELTRAIDRAQRQLEE